jgi:hypothetical protein
MSYRQRDPLEKATQPPPGPVKRPGVFHALRQAVRDAVMRLVSTKQ